jgi:parallel beta-helix repeat protein
MDAVELRQDSVVVVSSNTALRDALDALSAGAGGTILLDAAGGPYDVNASGQGHPTEIITIMSADPDDRAVVQRISAVESRNLTFSDLTVDSTEVYQDRRAYFTDLDIYRSTNITVQNSQFQSAAEGYFDGTGEGYVYGETLGKVRDSEGFSFVGNTVSNYGWGLLVQESNDTVISDNSFSKIQMDGLRLVGVQTILIEDNSFTDWLGSTFEVNHDDMIQIWSTGAIQVTENVTIRGNLLMAGDDAATQSIFIRNEIHSGDENAYRNIVIEDNTIHNGHTHGISVGGTIGLRIANNTVLYNDQVGIQRDADSAPGSSMPTIRVDTSREVTVENNIAGGYTLFGNDSVNNVTVNYTNPSSDSFVSKHFVNAALGGSLDLRDLQLLEDSPFAGLGSSAVQPGPAINALSPGGQRP